MNIIYITDFEHWKRVIISKIVLALISISALKFHNEDIR